jgi:hypoxanthine phosphoribosyltransferase
MQMYMMSWDEIDRAIHSLTEHIKNLGIKYIYGVPRGGLIPAVMLSHRIGAKLVDQEQLEVDRPEKLLIIDDIFETGLTMSFYKETYPNAQYVCLFCKQKDMSRLMNSPIQILQELGNDWVVFPWEDPEKANAEFFDYCQRRKASETV